MGKTQKIGNATIMNIDCMEYMKTLPDKFFDLAIVDPPYGIGMDGEIIAMSNNSSNKWKKAKGTGYIKKKWDSQKPDKEYFDTLMICSKNQIVWGGNYFDLPQSSGWIFWDKGTAEEMTLSPGELAWTSFNKSVNKISILWAGFRKVEICKRIHPTQKPVKLYEWILTNYAKPGQTIFDSHMGSGSSAIACNNLGFEYIGCELDEDYYSAACERIEHHASQERLFA